jgi:hypothetical protein
MCDGQDVFELLNSCDQELTVGHLVEIRKQNAIEEVEELQPEPRERAIIVLTLTVVLGLTATGIKVFEGIDWIDCRNC